MSTDLAALVVRLEVQNAKYVDQLDQATKKLNRFSADTKAGLTDLAKKVAALFAVKEVVEFSKNVLEGLDNLNKLSQSTGIQVESLSKLQFAFGQAGVDSESLGTAVKKLNVNIAEAAGNAKSDAAIAFKALGISVLDAGGHIKAADVILGEIANKYQGYADGANKTAISVALLGKAADKMIPGLNGGAAGLKELGDQAAAAGIVISKDTAQAAEDFIDKARVLKLTLIDGLAVRVAADLLPTMSALADSFVKTKGAAEGLDVAAATISELFRTLIGSAIAAYDVIKNVATAIWAVAQAQGHLVQLDPKAALNDLKSGFQDIGDQVKADYSRVMLLIDNGNKKMAAGISQAASHHPPAGPTTDAPSLAGAKASAAALQSITDFAAGIEDQAKAFGLGGVAAVKYKLSIGPLAESLKLAGAEGQRAAASALHYAAVLQAKVDTKAVDAYKDSLLAQIATFGQGEVATTNYALHTGDLGKALDRLGANGEKARASILGIQQALTAQKSETALQQIDIQVQTLTGHLVDAAAAAFDLSQKSLTDDLKAAGDTAGLARVQTLKDATVAQAAFNEQVAKAQVIQDDLALAEERIQNSARVGAISELDALQQTDEARKGAVVQLDAIAQAETRIAQSSGIDALAEQAKKSTAAVATLASETGLLAQKISTDLQDSFANAFVGLIDGTQTAGQALHSFFLSIEKDIADLVAKDFAKRLFGDLLNQGGGAGGGGTGWLGALIGLFGGAKAAGGPVRSNMPYLVGERGPELFVPGASGQIVPNSGMSGGKTQVNHFNFMIPADNGYVNRQTQQQIAANAARAISLANRRGN